MNLSFSYLFLILAVFLGVTSNSFAKSAEGFTLIVPSIITAVTIVLCMYALSIVMKTLPVGVTYASFAGLAIIATVVVGAVKFNQVPNLYTIIGLVFIIIGVMMVNLLRNS
jgi:small multidrug resistance pump